MSTLLVWSGWLIGRMLSFFVSYRLGLDKIIIIVGIGFIRRQMLRFTQKLESINNFWQIRRFNSWEENYALRSTKLSQVFPIFQYFFQYASALQKQSQACIQYFYITLTINAQYQFPKQINYATLRNDPQYYRQMLRFIQQAKIISTFCQIKKPLTYPYLFGGLPSSTYPQRQSLDQEIVVLMQNKEIKQNFREAYLSYLDGLLNKDLDYLSTIVSKELLENISFEDVKLVNTDQPTTAKIDKEYLIIGAGLNRDEHVGPWIMVGDQQDNFFFKIYRTKQATNIKPSILFGVEVYFKSKVKLVRPDASPTDLESEQIHMVQFECERKQYPVFSIYKIALSEAWKSLFNRSKDFDIQVLKRVLDMDNCYWRIADVDRLLNGNFDKLRQKQENS